MKKLIAFMCTLICALALTACGASNEVDTILSTMVEGQTTQFYTVLSQMPEDQLEQYINAKNSEIAATDEEALMLKRAFTSWRDAQKDLGAFISQEGFECTKDKGTVTGTINLKYEKHDAKFIVIYNEDVSAVQAMKMEPQYSLGEKMANAGLNTLMGMGIVFLVLIFIALLISLFKYISKAENYLKTRKERKAQADLVIPPPVAEVTPVVIEPAEEQVDDLELIAVITAAIAASMNTSVDNLVVRSIRKRKSGR